MATQQRTDSKVSGVTSEMTMPSIESIDSELQEMIRFFVSNHGLKIRKEHLEETGQRYRTQIMKMIQQIQCEPQHEKDTLCIPHINDPGVEIIEFHKLDIPICSYGPGIMYKGPIKPGSPSAISDHPISGPTTPTAPKDMHFLKPSRTPRTLTPAPSQEGTPSPIPSPNSSVSPAPTPHAFMSAFNGKLGLMSPLNLASPSLQLAASPSPSGSNLKADWKPNDRFSHPQVLEEEDQIDLELPPLPTEDDQHAARLQDTMQVARAIQEYAVNLKEMVNHVYRNP